MFHRKYSLSKSRGVLKWCYQWYSKNWSTIQKNELVIFEKKMENLDGAILIGDKSEASRLAKELEEYGHGRIKSSTFHYVKEIIFALVIALALATLVRMTWFELYKIPTGSMRPTYKEEDHLIVSKTTHGINIPLLTNHFYFDPDKVIRGNPVIWSGDQVDIPNNDTKYFWIFPSKKRYIKRLIGKPGDTLYFYGGKIYGIDSEGNRISELLDNPHLKGLEYIPFTSFEGKPVNVKPDNSGIAQQTLFMHFNRPIGRVTYNWLGKITGEIKTPDGWQKGGSNGMHFYDIYGIKNFAMARLLNEGQLSALYPKLSKQQPKAPLYLELRYHPTLKDQTLTPNGNRNHSLVTTDVSVIPLSEEHMKNLMNALYTARFDVVDNRARLYSESPYSFNAYNPGFPGVDDGTYEFYYGKASKIGFKGLSTELPQDHPLYEMSTENLQKLFNLGTNFSEIYSPHHPNPFYQPARFAYFRNGDLYVMGSPVLLKDDPTLSQLSFVDSGSPTDEVIQKYGLKIPEGHYLVLGDNHAMSADSRFFGFVPEENLQGTPSFIFWPPGSNFGFPNQASYPYFTISNVVVWSIVAIVLVVWWIFHRRNLKQSVYKKLSK